MRQNVQRAVTALHVIALSDTSHITCEFNRSWYQGETDAGNDETVESYLGRFTSAVASWRGTLPAPAAGPEGALCITVQLNRVKGVTDPEQHRRWTQVREAQRQAALRLDGVAIVSTFDQSLTDGIHNSPASNMLMGERMARAALGLAGKGISPDAHRAPEPVSAFVGADGLTVSLRFANVPAHSRIGCIDPLSVPFRLEDSRGEVPLTRCVYPSPAEKIDGRDDTMTLVCDRPIVPAAAGGSSGVVLHGAYGCDPDTVPWDVERALPMLGFYGLAVQRGLSNIARL